MIDVLFVAMGLLHLIGLIAVILIYLHHVQLPQREWPMLLFVMLWASMVLAGYLLSPFDALDSLQAYFVASFMAVGLVLLAHRSVYALPRKTPYTKITYPDFVQISSPRLRKFLWWLLGGSLVLAFVGHLIVCFSFYPVNADSLNYRLPRVFWYVSHGNLLHPFASIDKRLTFYPLNGILLYVPLALYGLSSIFFGLPSLFSWVALSYTSYRFARALQAEKLVAFFTMWLVALTPSILIEASSTNDEILTATPLVIGLFFAWRWLTTGAEHYFFLFALGAGLCVGTKLHVFFLIPIAGLALLWFIVFLIRRRESWRQWVPDIRLSVFLLSGAVFAFYGLMFLVLNYLSSGDFYFLGDTANQVLNLGASLQAMVQNFMIYLSEMILSPIADLNFWQTFHEREVTNQHLNQLLTPLVRPFVSPDPSLYHLKYRFQGVVIPTAVLLVEYGLWPAFMYLLWPLQASALFRQRFTLRPFFIVLASIPFLWFLIWSCVTLYMEGVPTYFAFYLMCAAPAMGFVLARSRTIGRARLRTAVLIFVVVTNLIVDGNVLINNTFRGLWHFGSHSPWPYDWLKFEQPIIDEIKRAKRIQIAITHGKVYYFAFMHWNPTAVYYTPYAPVPDPDKVLHIITTPSEGYYGFMPIEIPFKRTAGLTYLGHIRGVDREEIFAFGNGIQDRHPGMSDFISMHLTGRPKGDLYTIALDQTVAGMNPEDHLEFRFTVSTLDKKAIFERPWGENPSFSLDVPHDPQELFYTLTVSVRSMDNHADVVTETFQIGGRNAWRIMRPGETPNTIHDDDDD